MSISFSAQTWIEHYEKEDHVIRFSSLDDFRRLRDYFPFSRIVIHLEVGFNNGRNNSSVPLMMEFISLTQLDGNDVSKLRTRIFCKKALIRMKASLLKTLRDCRCTTSCPSHKFQNVLLLWPRSSIRRDKNGLSLFH